MKALDTLAVAERDILALRTARENRARSGDSTSSRARLALSVHQGPPCNRHSTATATAPHSTTDGLTPPQPLALLASLRSLRCSSLARLRALMKERDSARHGGSLICRHTLLTDETPT